MPTHVWFADNHPPSPRILGDIFSKCREERLEGLTFVLSPYYEFGLRSGAWRYHLGRLRRMIRRRRRTAWELWHAPRGCRFEFVRRHDDPAGGRWATRLEEPLFNLRTAFTSALNYLAVRHPGSEIRLVGTDFNTPGYFFEEEMRRLKLPWDDWTAAMQEAHGVHSAAIEHDGRTVFDSFPFMKESLDRAGIRLTCNNPSSDTVLRGLAEYAPICPDGAMAREAGL